MTGKRKNWKPQFASDDGKDKYSSKSTREPGTPHPLDQMRKTRPLKPPGKS